MSKIIFITGGARSGKSSFVLKEAGKIEGRRAFIATAQALDSEMKERIERHRKERGEEWDTYEEPLRITETIDAIKDQYSVIVIDCLTLWVSNLVIEQQSSRATGQQGNRATGQQSSRAAGQQYIMVKQEMEKFVDTLKRYKEPSTNALRHYCTTALFIISNEVGMGIVPDNEMARGFRDLLGYLNQEIAKVAHEVYLLVSGISVKIKG